MTSARPAPSTQRVLVEHMSSVGPTITHVRGLMLVNVLNNLRAVGMFEEYARVMPPMHLEVVTQTMATTWVPVAHLLAHYEACDRLPLTQEHINVFGQRTAQSVTDTFLGLALQRVRMLGVDGVKPALAQISRLHERLYQGGGCTVLDAGPKDVVIEIHGFPFAGSRTFRSAWVAYLRSVCDSFAKTAYVKLVRPREPHPHRAAAAGSWV